MTPAAETSPHPGYRSLESLAARYGPHYRWLAVMAVGIGTFAAMMMTTSINVALPSIMGAFGVSQDTAQWLSTGYLAGTTISMLTLSWCISRLGIRLCYLLPTLAFCFASILGATSTSIEVMIVARIIQGAAGGLYMPLSSYLLTQVFPADKRGLAMGIFGIVTITGPAIGPWAGGLMIDTFNWRAAFILALPMSVISIPLAHMLLPDRDPEAAEAPLDWWSILLLSITMGFILNAVTHGPANGWDSNRTLLGITVGLTSFALFLWRQPRIAVPLMDLRLFSYPVFLQSTVISLIYGIALYGGMYLIPLFLQSIQQISPTQAGLVLLPGGFCMAFAMLAGGFLSDRMPGHILMVAGLLLMAYSFGVMHNADHQTSTANIVLWIIYGRIGISIITPALNLSAFSSLPNHLLSQASGTSSFLRQMGGTFGVNAISVYLARQTSLHMQQITDTQQAGNDQTLQMLDTLSPLLDQAGIDALNQAPLAVSVLAGELYLQAQTMAFQDAFVFAGALGLLGIIPAWMIKYTRLRSAS